MLPFDFHLRTRIVFGPDKIDLLGEVVSQLGALRVLVVSDRGIRQAGHTQRALDGLQRAGVQTALFEGVHENPTTADVASGLEMAQAHRPDALVGLGGGSSLDCAKGINFLYTNGGRMQDYWGVGKAQRPMLPMIAVPTTAGTGSETQSFALISDAQTHVKMACGDKKASFHTALLDPKLTLTQPAKVTALTGIDAMVHAIETYVTRPRNAVSLVFSREAWRLLAGSFERVLDAPDDLAARGDLQLGACFAGVAIEHSMLGAAHALANPLSAACRMVHGHAVGLMLPHVIRFNAVETAAWYATLAQAAAENGAPIAPPYGAERLADFLHRLLDRAGLATRLSDCGLQRQQLPELAAQASQQWTAAFNPRKVDQEDLLRLYQQAL